MSSSQGPRYASNLVIPVLTDQVGQREIERSGSVTVILWSPLHDCLVFNAHAHQSVVVEVRISQLLQQGASVSCCSSSISQLLQQCASVSCCSSAHQSAVVAVRISQLLQQQCPSVSCRSSAHQSAVVVVVRISQLFHLYHYVPRCVTHKNELKGFVIW